MLQYVLFLKQHSSQERLHGYLVTWSPLAQPVNQIHFALEELGVIQWQIGGGDGNTPLVGTCIGLTVTVDNLEQGGHSLWIVREEYGLLSLLDGEVHVVEQYGTVAVNSLQSLYLQNLCARLTLHLEDDTWVFTC